MENGSLNKKQLQSEKKHTPLHGGDIYSHPVQVDFSVNTNPLGPPRSVIRALQEHCMDIVHYPDPSCKKLREAIASYEKLGPQHIICGNGAAELIYSLVENIKPQKALLVEPAFSEYERALKFVGADCRYYSCLRENGFKLKEDILNYITPDLGMIFLCNPGNPVGEVIEENLLRRILNLAEKYYIPVLLDECFLDFLEDAKSYEALAYYKEYPNLFILKAFTKIFAMPGLRLGYMISCQEDLLKKMEEGLPSWHVSSLAQVCGEEALKAPEDYLKETKEYLNKEKNWMIQGLKDLGFHIYGSKANYIFFSIEEDNQEIYGELYHRLLADQILIRDCSNYPGLSKGNYRIAIKSRQENEKLIQWLNKAAGKGRING